MIKRILHIGIILVGFLILTKTIHAQYEQTYTQFMDNLLVINPAVAGSNHTANLSIFSRNQWVAFDGAPVSRSLAFESPVNTDKIGLGLSILTNQLGPFSQTGVYFDYSYFLKLNMDYKLGLGLKSGFNFYKMAYTELQTIDPDPIYDQDLNKNFLPNFGVGFFLFSEDFYLALSIPKLIKNTLTRDNYSSEYLNKEEVHFYFLVGKKFKINDHLQIKTASLLKYTQDFPIALDLNAMIGFREKFWIGGMYSFNNSYGLLTQFNISEKITVGYSYDLAYSFYKTFNNGTHEIMFNYKFDFNNNSQLTAEKSID